MVEEKGTSERSPISGRDRLRFCLERIYYHLAMREKSQERLNHLAFKVQPVWKKENEIKTI